MRGSFKSLGTWKKFLMADQKKKMTTSSPIMGWRPAVGKFTSPSWADIPAFCAPESVCMWALELQPSRHGALTHGKCGWTLKCYAKCKKPVKKELILHDFINMKYQEEVNLWRQKVGERLPGLRDRAEWEWLPVRTGFILGWQKCSQRRLWWWVHSPANILNVLDYILLMGELYGIWIRTQSCLNTEVSLHLGVSPIN